MRITIEKLEVNIDEETVDKFMLFLKSQKKGKTKRKPAKPKTKHREDFKKHLEAFTVSKFPESAGYTEIAAYLNSINFPTIRGRAWHTNSVRQLLVSDPTLIPNGLILNKRNKEE